MKILAISDDLRFPSGVGRMTAEIVKNTIPLGFEWVQFGGGKRHPQAGQIVTLDDGTKIIPTEGYADMNLIRAALHEEQPDALFFFTDPRQFVGTLFRHERELRAKVPLVYYNIWDSLPIPQYNRAFYNSCDGLIAISRQTYAINEALAPNVSRSYVPHGIDTEQFRPIPRRTLRAFEESLFPGGRPDFVVGYVSRNLRRKSVMDLMLAFKLFSEQYNGTTALVMRTEPVDGEGTDLIRVANDLQVRNVVFVAPQGADEMNLLFNSFDITANIAANEGFGISTIESLAAGTPILVNVTGGLQDQCGFLNGDREIGVEDYSPKWASNHDGRFKRCGSWAFPVFPRTRSLTGHPQTPYIAYDVPDVRDVAHQLAQAATLGRETMENRGERGREYLFRARMTSEQMGEGIASAITAARAAWMASSRPKYVIHRVGDPTHNELTNPGLNFSEAS